MNRFSVFLEELNTSFWFLPGILAAASIAVAFAFLNIDERYISELDRTTSALFGGSAEAARELLATIAGSLITVISIAFSITIVALQQAAAQYSPRVLRNFTKDRGNQVVLGMYVATFIYALLVLRSVRTETDGAAGFVPALSVTFALFLTLVCLGLLIYFISHISTSLQVEHILSQIHEDLVDQIEELYPEKIGVAVDGNRQAKEMFEELSREGNVRTIRAKQAGFVRSVNESALKLDSEDTSAAVYIMPHVGEFVFEGAPIITVSSERSIDDHVESALEKAVVLDNQRSIEQDPLYAIRQLVDVALRALSPGINDPTTAEYSLLYLGDAMSRLANREFPARRRSLEDGTNVVVNRPDWSDFITHSFDQIRIASSNNLHVTGKLVKVLEKTASSLPKGNRWRPLLEQLQEIRQNTDKLPVPQTDIAMLQAEIDKAEQTLRKVA